MKFYRTDLEIWGSGEGRLRCRAVVAGAAEVGLGVKNGTFSKKYLFLEKL